jgi:predicted transcriptional regulator
MLLLRMVTAGPAVCWLSIQRLARDCNMEPRTVARYRSALVEDGALDREKTDDGRTVFWINWHRLVELACEGLMRRPAKERVAIIKNTFRPLINSNVLPINRDWLERWSDPATKPADSTPGHFKRKRQNPASRQGIHTPRQGIQEADKVSAPPDTMPGPSEPELNPNPEPESTNGPLKGPLVAGADQDGREQFGDKQVEDAIKPTLLLEVLHSVGRPWTLDELADGLEMRQSQVEPALKELCLRGYTECRDDGRYVVTFAGTKACQDMQRRRDARCR